MLHKAIKGFEDYLISDDGKVYSLKSRRYLKIQCDRYGYQYVHLSDNSGGKKLKIHRLVAQAFIKNPENNPTVDHINRIKTDNRVENLRWATAKEQADNKNKEEMVKHCQRIARLGGSKGGKIRGDQLKIPIYEILDDEIILYGALQYVPNINKTTLSYHINKGKTEFYANGRHFKIKGVM